MVKYLYIEFQLFNTKTFRIKLTDWTIITNLRLTFLNQARNEAYITLLIANIPFKIISFSIKETLFLLKDNSLTLIE